MKVAPVLFSLFSVLSGCAGPRHVASTQQVGLMEYVKDAAKRDQGIVAAMKGSRASASRIRNELSDELWKPQSLAGESGLSLIVRANALFFALGDDRLSEILASEPENNRNTARYLLDFDALHVSAAKALEVLRRTPDIKPPAVVAMEQM